MVYRSSAATWRLDHSWPKLLADPTTETNFFIKGMC